MNTVPPIDGQSNLDGLAQDLEATKIQFRRGLLASALTTYCIGGPIELLVEPDSVLELQGVFQACQARRLGWKTLGAGSNLLVNDRGVGSDPVIRLGRGFRGVESISSEILRVGGSAALMTLSRTVSEDGLSGLEFAGGIPASIGGAVRMNAGAHGGQIGDLIEQVIFIDSSGQLVTWGRGDLNFAYRHSNIPAGAIVVSADLKLTASDRQKTTKLRNENLAERKLRQPLSAPSAGSVFRNPSVDRSAGMVIEQAGLKGRAIGGATISVLHANWIINKERKATFDDVVGLVDLAQKEALGQFGIELIPEIVRWNY